MKRQNNIVVAALAGILVGVLMGAGTVQYAQVMAFNAPNVNYIKSQDITDFYPRVQVRGEQVHGSAFDVPEHCKELNPFSRRGILCRELYNQQDVVYEQSEYRSR